MKTFKQFIKEDKAKEGEGDLLWHVSGRNRDEKKRFTPMSHFGSQQAAREAGQERESHSKSSTGNRSVYAVRVQHKKSFETDDIGDHSPHKLLSHLHKKGMFSSSEYNEHKKHIITNPTSKKEQNNNNAYLAKAINSKGYDSLHYTNDREDIGSISHIITKPEQVRVVKSRTGHSYGRHRLYLRDKPPDWAHRATPWAGFEDDEMFDEEYFKQFIRENNRFTRYGQAITSLAGIDYPEEGDASGGGSCGRTAYALHKHLKSLGHDSHYVIGKYNPEKGETTTGWHSWVRVGRRIIDPTHGQFRQGNDEEEPRYRTPHTLVTHKDDKRYSEWSSDKKAERDYYDFSGPDAWTGKSKKLTGLPKWAKSGWFKTGKE